MTEVTLESKVALVTGASRNIGRSIALALAAGGAAWLLGGVDAIDHGVERALEEPDTELRLFGKPAVDGRRRMGVTLALGENVEQARDKARRAAAAIVSAAELR